MRIFRKSNMIGMIIEKEELLMNFKKIFTGLVSVTMLALMCLIPTSVFGTVNAEDNEPATPTRIEFCQMSFILDYKQYFGVFLDSNRDVYSFMIEDVTEDWNLYGDYSEEPIKLTDSMPQEGLLDYLYEHFDECTLIGKTSVEDYEDYKNELNQIDLNTEMEYRFFAEPAVVGLSHTEKFAVRYDDNGNRQIVFLCGGIDTKYDLYLENSDEHAIALNSKMIQYEEINEPTTTDTTTTQITTTTPSTTETTTECVVTTSEDTKYTDFSTEQQEQLSELKAKGDMLFGEFSREEKEILGEIEPDSARVTMEDVSALLSSENDFQQVYHGMLAIAGYPDFIGGSGVTDVEFWLDETGMEKILLILEQEEAYYVDCSEDGTVVNSELLYSEKQGSSSIVDEAFLVGSYKIYNDIAELPTTTDTTTFEIITETVTTSDEGSTTTETNVTTTTVTNIVTTNETENTASTETNAATTETTPTTATTAGETTLPQTGYSKWYQVVAVVAACMTGIGGAMVVGSGVMKKK
jgi:hypothetical protein